MNKISAKCKLCRRAGEKLFLKGERCSTPKCAIIRKPFAPGMHGAKSRRSQSEYGQQLAMKQKIKRMYVILEKQLKKYFLQIANKPGVIGDLLMQKLEMRLDNVIYRSGLASSRRQARQIVRNAALLVNERGCNIPSRELRVGDKIRLKESKKNSDFFKQNFAVLKEKKGSGTPLWLEFDPIKEIISIKSKPNRDDFESGLDAQMVVEFYSR